MNPGRRRRITSPRELGFECFGVQICKGVWVGFCGERSHMGWSYDVHIDRLRASLGSWVVFQPGAICGSRFISASGIDASTGRVLVFWHCLYRTRTRYYEASSMSYGGHGSCNEIRFHI